MYICIYVCQNVPSSTELNSPDDNAELTDQLILRVCPDYSTRCPKVRSHMEAGHVKSSRSSFRAGGPGFIQLTILSCKCINVYIFVCTYVHICIFM